MQVEGVLDVRDQTHRQGLSKDPSEEGTALEQGVLHVVHRRDLLHRLAQLVSLPHLFAHFLDLTSHLCLIKHLADVLNDDGDDEVGDGDGDHEDEEHEQGLNNAIAAAHIPY